MKLHNIILCGGSGSRLWPLSRGQHPKQFIPLINNQSLLQNTIKRANALPNASSPLLVCNTDHRHLVQQQATATGCTPDLLIEPMPRNTAPAIAAAAFYLQQQTDDPMMLVMPSDHLITDVEAFEKAVKQAIPHAETGKLMVFGIRPTHVETGYGYIHAGQTLGDTLCTEVQRFVEKPDHDTAQMYLASGEYFWNSGIFLFKASSYLNELAKLNSAMHAACAEAVHKGHQDPHAFLLDADAFAHSIDESVDYAVFEKARNVAMVKLDAGWCDLGSWSALAEVGETDDAGNQLIGDILAEGTRNTYINASHRLVAAIGLEDHVVVETKDAVLISSKQQCQDVKSIVSRLKTLERTEAQSHTQVQRPWGYYETLEDRPGFKVKRIVVYPGASLSLQLHHHRSEHWVVVRGTATVTKGEETFTLQCNESTYISREEKHRLANKSANELEIVETQVGDYLEEDDIIRLDDIYGRVKKTETVAAS